MTYINGNDLIVATREFHQRCAKLLQNFDDIDDIRKAYVGCHEVRSDKTEMGKTERIEKGVVQNESETISDKKSDSPRKVVCKPNITSNEDVNQTIESAKTLKPEKYIDTAKVGFYDFAGQDIFHASHPTFLSPKSIYTLVFDLNMMYRQKVEKLRNKYEHVKFFGDCRGDATLGDIGKSIFFTIRERL